jgi:hypothetical protein
MANVELEKTPIALWCFARGNASWAAKYAKKKLKAYFGDAFERVEWDDI